MRDTKCQIKSKSEKKRILSKYDTKLQIQKSTKNRNIRKTKP